MKSNRIHQLLLGFTLFTFSAQMTGQDMLQEYFSPPKNGKTYVIAHRGVHNGIPENSLAAYQKAIDLGCDLIEIDVRKSKDGRMVSVHNSTIDAYVSGATGKVSDFTLAELKALDIGERFGLTRERVRQIKDKAINKLRSTTRSKLLKHYLGA